MNIEDLKKIIHEEMVKVMREELREILTEAVEVIQEQKAEPVQHKKLARLANIVQEEETGYQQPRSITNLLQETARNMSREDLKTFSAQPKQPQQTMSGLPDFVAAAAMKAKAIFDKSNEKDLERYGI